MWPGAAPAGSASGSELPIVIVGAGLAGVCQAILLKRAGFQDITILEAAADVGGTWRDNTYPGCACDVPSAVYSYSFEPFAWPEHWGSQPDILAYIRHVIAKHGLARHIELNSRVTGATFDEASCSWVVDVANKPSRTARLLVLAAGGLSVPSTPHIKGASGFRGPVFHSARWDHSVQLAGKRVALVGSGASSIQILPELQPLVKELVLFQRTPAWVFPRRSSMPAWVKPPAQCSRVGAWLLRQGIFWLRELVLGLALIHFRADRHAKLEHLARRHLHARIKDPSLRAALTPNYRLGCKRILISDTFYRAVAQPNVRVVPSGLAEVKADGTTLVASDGSEAADVDVIIMATGFDTLGPMRSCDVRGVGGAELAATLQASGFTEYLGVAVPRFPNMFLLLGANTALGHNSYLAMLEAGAGLIVRLAQHMRARRLAALEVATTAAEHYTRSVRARLQATVWLAGGCRSWYLDEGGSSHVLWPGLCAEFIWRCSRLRLSDWVAWPARAATQPRAKVA